MRNKKHDAFMYGNEWFHSKFIQKDGCEVMNEDWDFLILLDACRYDSFEEENSISGDLQFRYSLGGTSWEFMRNNFIDKRLHDTVYVSSNPHSAKLDGRDIFHSHILLDEREDQKVVSPSKVTEMSMEIASEFPNKRLIVHYMPPHYPYLGDMGDKLIKKYIPEDYQSDLSLAWTMDHLRTRLSPISVEECMDAYRENLRIALDAVADLLDNIDGKAIVSSDHGELFGERVWPLPQKMFGHRSEIHHPHLRKVPWLVVDSQSRRRITTDEPISSQTNMTNVETRLESLGYK